MARTSRYDAGLTDRLREFQRVVGPATPAGPAPGGAALTEPGSAPLAAAGAEQAPAEGPSGGPPSVVESEELNLLQELLPEIGAWSDQLDQASDPTQGFVLAQAAAIRAQSLGERIRTYLASVGPGRKLGGVLSKLLAFLATLTHNALARMEEFARELGVRSFSVTIASTPPGISVTFNFGQPEP